MRFKYIQTQTRWIFRGKEDFGGTNLIKCMSSSIHIIKHSQIAINANTYGAALCKNTLEMLLEKG